MGGQSRAVEFMKKQCSADDARPCSGFTLRWLGTWHPPAWDSEVAPRRSLFTRPLQLWRLWYLFFFSLFVFQSAREMGERYGNTQLPPENTRLYVHCPSDTFENVF